MKYRISISILFFSSFLCFGQNRMISGKVYSAKDKASLIGVNVFNKVSKQATVTGEDGHYNLEAAPNSVFIFSYLGYSSKEVNIGNDMNFNVQLAEDLQLLSEIIVTGYGSQIKRDLTGNISKIRAEDVITSSALILEILPVKSLLICEPYPVTIISDNNCKSSAN